MKKVVFWQKQTLCMVRPILRSSMMKIHNQAKGCSPFLHDQDGHNQGKDCKHIHHVHTHCHLNLVAVLCSPPCPPQPLHACRDRLPILFPIVLLEEKTSSLSSLSLDKLFRYTCHHCHSTNHFPAHRSLLT